MKKCIGIYLRLSLEDVDKRTNKAKDESNSIVAQRQLIQRHIEQNPYLSNWHRWSSATTALVAQTLSDRTFRG